jgi:TnsA endonuclease N terminal/TnsA endonuclease C terminal
MSKHRRKMNTSAIRKLISQGRGQSSGQNYQPWIRVQEFLSQGQRNRLLGWKTGRQHDYFSLLELYYHYILDWSPVVTDIQEQFPLLSCNSRLPLEDTILIARQCGIRHPIDTETKEPVPLTTDFVITVRQSIGVIKMARTVKEASKLSKKRVIEKFEIERRYWKDRGVDWGIVTEVEIDKILAQNIDWVHPYRSLSSLQPLTNQAVQRIAKTLARILTEDTSPLCDVALSCDDRLGLESGTSLAVVRHLIANKQWEVDHTQLIHPGRRLNLVGISIPQSNKKASAQ